MGKKVKKTRNANKERRVSSGSPITATTTPTNSNQSAETVGGRVLVVEERKPCAHIETSVDLDKISSKFTSLESVKCDDCREVANDRRASKVGRSKHGKKKGLSSTDRKSDSKAIWVCLECGHFACGGVGFPTTPQSHAFRHSKQSHHSCVIKFENPHLRWCFACDSVIRVEKSEDNGEHKDILSDVVKLIKGKISNKGASMDVEDVWFGSGKAGDDSESQVLDMKGGYMVKGLSNLGNTCFFNSVMQNILAMDQLRAYFLKLDQSFGPLTMALKKLFIETSKADSRNGINPQSLFGCICTKAPQFRGYQQQDSHELLRYLLDGLGTEEQGTKKMLNSSGEEESASTLSTTLVDVTFGGQLSSTVCCVECGHSSVVHEPFLDLSLPVPTKKPPSKKPATVSRPKKTKFPSKKEIKRGGKNWVKGKVDSTPPLTHSVTAPSESKETSSTPSASGPVKEETPDDFGWLDYIGPDAEVTEHNEHDSIFQMHDSSFIQDSDNKQALQTEALSSESQSQILCPNKDIEPELSSSHTSSCKEELPLQVQGSEVLLLPYKEESLTSEEVMTQAKEPSSSIVVCGQDTIELDGLGDLFNEPEIESDPKAESFQANDMIATSFSVGNSSESDPDVVDDRDAPVSINTCLAYFTKPELLSDEHGWHCENCSRAVRRGLATDSQPENTLKTHTDGGTVTIQKASDLVGDFSSFNEHKNLDNGNPESETDSTAATETLLSHNSRPDGSTNFSKRKISPMNKETDPGFMKCTSYCKDSHPELSQQDRFSVEFSHTPQEPSPAFCHYKSSNEAISCGQADDFCSANEPDSTKSNVNQVESMDTEFSAAVRESSESEEVDSKSVKVKRDATKRILINRAPPILTIHLKRFSQDRRGRLSKLSGHVNFQDTIDLRPYIDPRSIEENTFNYRLLGIVEHSGTMRGGHYVAYVRGEKSGGTDDNGEPRWFYASDSHVREVSLTEVLRSEAYILFYEKI